MATVRQHGRVRRIRPWWRPLMYSAATAAAIAALFNPLPAAAAPVAPAAPPAAAVPDAGSRPVVSGTLLMPGQASATTPATQVSVPGVVLSPVMVKIEKRRTEVAKLAEDVTRLEADRTLAQQQVATATLKAADAQTALSMAEADARVAAAASLRHQAALPPGTIGSGLADLDNLSRMQRGETATEGAAARQLAIARAALAAAQAEQATAQTGAIDLESRHGKLSAQLTTKTAALQKFEQENAAEISAAEATENATDQSLGQNYLQGAPDGRGADSRAVAAVAYARREIGEPYEWSEEGPDTFDCSGLMYWSYRKPEAGAFPLQRVSRDQYDQTREKPVSRYALLPGDLLFFSSSNSWQDIHHVAMYSGNGKMIEAPRTGLNVREVPVRWSRLFQATRIYGSVDGPTTMPNLPPAQGNNGGGTGNGNGSGNGNGTTNPAPSTSARPPSAPADPPKSSNPPASSASPSTPTQPSTSPSPSASSSSATPSTNPNPPASSPGSPGTSPGGSPGGGSAPGESAPGNSAPGNSSGAESPSGSSSPSRTATQSATATKSATTTQSATATKSTSAPTADKSESAKAAESADPE